MSYIDTHCHLGSVQFDEDRDEVIARMMAEGADKAILICCSSHDLAIGEALRREYPGFKLACGIHPQSIRETDTEQRLEEFRKTVSACKPDVIGEIGLDYESHRHTKELQKIFFEEQLKLACELDLPVNIHSRKAVPDTQMILKKYPVRGILHSFSGSAETAAQYVRAGWLIAFGASVLFKNARRPIEAVQAVPLDHLAVETDAPYQSPIMGRRHEPADIIAIYRKIAEIKGISTEELCTAAEKNYSRLFEA